MKIQPNPQFQQSGNHSSSLNFRGEHQKYENMIQILRFDSSFIRFRGGVQGKPTQPTDYR